MTCEEIRRAIAASTPQTCPLDVLTEISLHVRLCAECQKWLKEQEP